MRKWFIILFTILLLLLPSQVLATEQSPTVSIQRIYGQDRYQTATAVADQLAIQFGINYSMGQKFQAVVLASGNNWPDAVSGTTLAKMNKAPILLLDKTTDAQGSQETFSYIKQHVSTEGKVFILGGTGVVSKEFTQYLINMGFSPSNIQQIGGINRDETSFMIAKMLNIHNFYLVSDQNFYDALTVAPPAAHGSYSVLLVSNSGLTVKGEKEYLDNSSIPITVGDLSNKIASIYPRAYNPYAIFKGAEYATNASMAGCGFETAFMATGEDYPDALTGSVLAGSIGEYQNTPIIFVKHNAVAPESVPILELIKTKPDAGSLRHVYVLGGMGAVTDNAVNQAINLITGIKTSSSNLSSANSITSFSFDDPEIKTELVEGEQTIKVQVPFGRHLSLVPTITISDNATISPASGEARDFSLPVTYVVTAQDGTRKMYNVSVTTLPESQSPPVGIQSFVFPSLNVSGTVDRSKHIVTVNVPQGTDVSNLAPIITLPKGYTVFPNSGVAEDFSISPVQYTVTDPYGYKDNYDINVIGSKP